MTTRHAGYVVTLKADIREDDAERLIAAILMLSPVASVEPIVADFDLHIAAERAKRELREQMIAVLWPEAKK